MAIVFKKIRWKNLLSTGNSFTEINLCNSPSTLIVGENGSGKSTFIEAISFALYGKPFRKINKPQLVNSINNKNLLAEIEFTIGKKEYLVRRGLKPAVFEIFVDGMLLNQDAASKDYQDVLEKNILRLTHKSFSQIITLGSSTFIPFMQLPAQMRRDFIEDLLDIQIFSTMNLLLKDKVQQNKDDISACSTKISLCEQRVELNKKHIESMRQNNDELILIKNKKIADHQRMIEEFNTNIESHKETIALLSVDICDLAKYKKKLKSISSIKNELTYKADDINKHISFFEEHDNCPTCTQIISTDVKESNLVHRKNKLEEVNKAIKNLILEETEITSKITTLENNQRKIDEINTDIRDNTNKISVFKKYNSELQAEIDALQIQQKKIELTDATLNESKNELIGLQETKELLTKKKILLNTASVLLKDGGIKTKIVKQYVPVINKLINKYLAAMDFFVQFELDENFDEKIKSRFRDEFSYSSFSEGEKMRIDLSLLFTWRAISKLRNSASTNLLIMDEVFDSSLDSSGTEEFFKILGGITTDTNVFIISHKGDQLADKFSNIIKFEKIKSFSQIAA